MKNSACFGAIIGVFVVQAALPAGTIRFDELGVSPLTSVNGVVSAGVLFEFTPPDSAFYNGAIGGGTVQLLDPVLEGDTGGVLTMWFQSPIMQLDFDVALSTMADIPEANPGPAYHVDLWLGAENVLSQDWAAAVQLFYAESRFTYTGAPIDRASVSFYNGQDPFGDPGQNVEHFALDNVAFASAGSGNTAPAPEPLVMMLLGSGLILLGLLRHNHTAN